MNDASVDPVFPVGTRVRIVRPETPRSPLMGQVGTVRSVGEPGPDRQRPPVIRRIHWVELDGARKGETAPFVGGALEAVPVK